VPWRKAAEMGTTHSWHPKGFKKYDKDLIFLKNKFQQLIRLWTVMKSNKTY